ncbi:carbohydrate ABC transporter permease [Vallitalea maricola]|uniref:Carbohydrate ABC transporter permease n=1 Tax=Vallitalea maricola TaxID=3074433 RepID=A0ACB5UHB8_9FIRM|nr:carbohydrate ABC transporter permease [Vallitalea sp. AN17-2]
MEIVMNDLDIKKKRTNSKKIKKDLFYFIIILLSLTMIIPFLWMISASLKPEIEVFEFPIRWIPKHIKWDNYVKVWTELPFMTYYWNTFKIAFWVTFLQIITCSLAAYSFSKIHYPERDKLFLGYLFTMMIPYQVIMIPQFMIIRKLGLVDTHLALILTGAFSPFGVFLFRQFFLGIPEEISQSARIDGCSEFGIYFKMILPLSKPAIASLVVFTFVDRWNDFLGPLIYINAEKLKTLQLGMRNFQTEYSSSYSLLMAAAVSATIPTIIIYLIAQDYFIEGIAATGIKG